MIATDARQRNEDDRTDVTDATGGAWRRLWRREADLDPGGRGEAPTAGVTYRGYLGITGGATDAWRTEQEIKQTQALLRMAAAAGRLGAWEVERARRTLHWSDEVKAMHGVRADFRPDFHRVLRLYTLRSQQVLLEAFEPCMERGVPFDVELELQPGHGRSGWIHVLGEADRDADGRITHVRGAMQDVSRFRAIADDARRTAERLTGTLEQLTDGFVLLDHEWRFVYLNPGAARILRRHRERLTGKCLLTEFPETASGRFIERCQGVMRDGRAIELAKYYPPLGIWIQMKIWRSDIGLTLCLHDDTERMNAQREILQLKAQVDALKAAAVR